MTAEIIAFKEPRALAGLAAKPPAVFQPVKKERRGSSGSSRPITRTKTRSGLDKNGYQREITVLRGRRKEASTLMPRVHRIAGLVKRLLLGTHQGAVAPQYLPYYLDEYTFRFNRRNSKSRGKLFFRLMQQAASTSPKTYDSLVGRTKSAQQAPQQVGVG